MEKANLLCFSNDILLFYQLTNHLSNVFRITIFKILKMLFRHHRTFYANCIYQLCFLCEKSSICPCFVFFLCICICICIASITRHWNVKFLYIYCVWYWMFLLESTRTITWIFLSCFQIKFGHFKYFATKYGITFIVTTF